MTDTISLFLTSRYNQQNGYCCIGHIDGDPAHEKMNQEWYEWPRQRRAVTTRLTELAERGLNIYAARCLFSERKRTYTNALPSNWLWIDDITASECHTELVETSPNNYQGWLKLDQEVSAQEAHQLQKRWRQAAGGDGCSADAVHMTRVPGGYNAKQHRRFQVRVADRRETVHQVDTLPWPPLPAESIELDIPTIELQHSNLNLLLNESGIPHRFKPNSFGAKVITGEIELRNKRGECDQSTPRYALAKSCAYHRYTPEDTAAILWHHTTLEWLEQKGAHWHQQDIERCISKGYEEVRRRTASQGEVWNARPLTARERLCGAEMVTPDSLPSAGRKSRARRDRPSRVTEHDLLTYWQEQCESCSNQYLYRRTEVAQALKVSLSTLDRLIRRLKDQERITIETPRRQLSIVTIINQADDRGTVNIPVKQSETPRIEVLSDNAAIPQPDEPETNVDTYRGTHSPELLPPVDLKTAVREAFDAYTEAQRLTRKAIRQYLTMNYEDEAPNWSDGAISFWIQTIRKERNWQKQIDALRSTEYAKLRRLERKISRVLTTGESGPEKALYAWACAMSGHVNAEIERREPMQDRANPKRQRARQPEPEPLRVCATVERLRKRKPVAPVRPAVQPGEASTSVQLPRLPDGWVWMFVPSKHMHRAHLPGTELRTKFYHSTEVQHITRDIRRLYQPGGAR